MKFCPTCKSKFPTDINYCPNDATRLIPDPEAGPSHSLIGMILDNRYRIISKLGEGGMGSVYSAEHVLLKKNVAVKVLRYDLARREDVVKRFQNEAIAASRIGHENIIEVTDFGRTPDGSVYFVMEHLSGSSLAEVIQRSGSIPLRRAVPILIQITKALSAAHSQGIIHRDLKPENIILIDKPDRKDFVKILDFGISKMMDASDRAEKLTAMGMIVGTPEYMSPEQAAGMPVDKRTDIYSLGVIMYEMMTGRLPFVADNAIRILMMHQTERPTRPREINPELPVSMEELILKCMEKRPEDRFQDMSEITQSLIQILSQSSRPLEPKKTIAFAPQVFSSTQEGITGADSVPIDKPRTGVELNTPLANPPSITTKEATSNIILDSNVSAENKSKVADNLSSAESDLLNTPYERQSESFIPNKTASTSGILEGDRGPSDYVGQDETEYIRSRGGNKRLIIIATIVVLFLVVLSGGIYLILSSKGGSDKRADLKGVEVKQEVTAPLQPSTTAIAENVENKAPEKEADVKVEEVKKEETAEKRQLKGVKAQEEVSLLITSEPENVEVYKGSTMLGVTPYQIKGRKNNSYELTFRKVGFEPLKKRIVLSSSGTMKVNLKKIEEKKRPAKEERDPFEKIDDLKDLKF